MSLTARLKVGICSLSLGLPVRGPRLYTSPIVDKALNQTHRIQQWLNSEIVRYDLQCFYMIAFFWNTHALYVLVTNPDEKMFYNVPTTPL